MATTTYNPRASGSSSLLNVTASTSTCLKTFLASFTRRLFWTSGLVALAQLPSKQLTSFSFNVEAMFVYSFVWFGVASEHDRVTNFLVDFSFL